MAIVDMPTNVTWEFDRDAIDANFAELTPIVLSAGSTISAVTTNAGHIGRLAIIVASAGGTATVKTCVALRSTVTAVDTWFAITGS